MSGVRTKIRGHEEGFTLIELMVVVLIMAILMAIAIPTFLGAKNGANDRAAQSNLTNVAIAGRSIYTSTGSYPAIATLVGTGGNSLASVEPSMSYTSGESTGASSISVGVDSTGQGVTYHAKSSTGKCWWIADIEGALSSGGVSNLVTGTSPGTYYAVTTYASSACPTPGSTLNTTGNWFSATTSNGFQSVK